MRKSVTFTLTTLVTLGYQTVPPIAL